MPKIGRDKPVLNLPEGRRMPLHQLAKNAGKHSISHLLYIHLDLQHSILVVCHE